MSAAKSAFDSYSQTPVAQRIELLTTIREIYKRRIDDVADAIQTRWGPRQVWQEVPKQW